VFNLIVTGGLENDRRGTITSDRVFEYTPDHIAERLQPGGQLDATAVLAFPTILMNEGTTNEVVRIGSLSRVELRGREYRLEFFTDPEIPRMTNADIFGLAHELNMHEFEFSRNHWAVKDVDLFQVLYRSRQSQQPRPTVFRLSSNPVNPRLISLMMPFAANFTRVYDTLKTAITAEGYTCTRADDIWVHDHIMQDIIELICTSKVVICDLSGKNPNVFYEAGIAHTLGKEVILITQSMEDVPFDLRALRCIQYLNNQEGCDRLAQQVLARLRTVA
jgi:hypothetical protein